MVTNPEPYYAIRNRNPKGAETKADPNRPEVADLFEMQGWMSRIEFQEFEVCVSKLPNRCRKIVVTVPEARGGTMNQRGLH